MTYSIYPRIILTTGTLDNMGRVSKREQRDYRFELEPILFKINIFNHTKLVIATKSD